MEREPPLISVCIANYNGDDVLDDCIKSIKSQVTTLAYEIIVHDDASTDKSLEDAQAKYKDIIFIASERNVGFCVGNNRMVKAASGEFILLLNNDAELLGGALAALVAAYKNPDAGVITLSQYQYGTNELFDNGMHLDLFLNPVPNRSRYEEEVSTVMGSLMFLKKDLWVKIGGFPEWFESIGEDLYVCLYARRLHKKILACHQSGYIHRIGFSFGGGKVVSDKMSTSLKRRALSERNKIYCLCIFFPLYYLVLVLPIHFVVLIFEGLVLSIISGRIEIFNKIYLAAIIGTVKNYKKLKSARYDVAAKCVPPNDLLKNLQYMPYKLKMLLKYGLPKIN